MFIYTQARQSTHTFWAQLYSVTLGLSSGSSMRITAWDVTDPKLLSGQTVLVALKDSDLYQIGQLTAFTWCN